MSARAITSGKSRWKRKVTAMYNISVLNNAAVESLDVTEQWNLCAKNAPDSDNFWNESHTHWDGDAYKAAREKWYADYDKAYSAAQAAGDKIGDMCRLIGADCSAVYRLARAFRRYEKRNGYMKSVDPYFGWDERKEAAYRRLVSDTKPEYKSGREWDAKCYDGRGYYAAYR